MTFVEEMAGWIRLRRSAHTRDAYSRDLSLWIEFCEGTGTDSDAPTESVVASFVDWLEMGGYVPLSRRRALASLSAGFSAKRPAQDNPFAKKNLWPSAVSYRPTDAVSNDDARRVIEAAGRRGRTPLRDAALLWVLWATGMRRVSVVSIHRRGVVHRGGLTILRHILKGGDQVETELSDEAARAVGAWLDVAPTSDWLFCSLNGRSLTPQSVTSIVAAAAEDVGIHIHPHQFRAAAITEALDAGIPIERVAKFVHHRDIRSTLRYDRGQRGAGVAAEVATFRKRAQEMSIWPNLPSVNSERPYHDAVTALRPHVDAFVARFPTKDSALHGFKELSGWDLRCSCERDPMDCVLHATPFSLRR